MGDPEFPLALGDPEFPLDLGDPEFPFIDITRDEILLLVEFDARLGDWRRGGAPVSTAPS
jgi:hypothetical protein